MILPVGISFYTFQTMSYAIDVYRREIAPTRNIINFLAYVSFFPQLVAGPIERAHHLLPQFERTLAITRPMLAMIAFVSGRSSSISSPMVAWPAMKLWSSNGWTNVPSTPA